jgi:small-conductance mechanosensitive channel
MLKRIATLFFLMLLALALWVANQQYPHPYLHKSFYTAVAVFVLHFFFKYLTEDLFAKRIRDAKTRYTFKKTTAILYLIILIAVVINIWIENRETLLVSYGIIAAGLAVSLQDLFKNFVGGIVIFVTGTYRVGDRIEVDSKRGDVIDIDILYTTLMEVGEWMSGDQATGRLTVIPNGYVLSNNINNYTKDHNFIWDDISIPITYDSDWNEAVTRILTVVKRETNQVVLQAEQSLSKLEEKYYLHRKVVEPAIFITLTDNWINLNIRYVTEVRERRRLKDKLNQMILREIGESDKIKIASTTVDIVGFPEVRINKNT